MFCWYFAIPLAPVNSGCSGVKRSSPTRRKQDQSFADDSWVVGANCQQKSELRIMFPKELAGSLDLGNSYGPQITESMWNTVNRVLTHDSVSVFGPVLIFQCQEFERPWICSIP